MRLAIALIALIVTIGGAIAIAATTMDQPTLGGILGAIWVLLIAGLAARSVKEVE